eukprot:452277-Hanusia_phi.AAC.1
MRGSGISLFAEACHGGRYIWGVGSFEFSNRAWTPGVRVTPQASTKHNHLGTMTTPPPFHDGIPGQSTVTPPVGDSLHSFNHRGAGMGRVVTSRRKRQHCGSKDTATGSESHQLQ